MKIPHIIATCVALTACAPQVEDAPATPLASARVAAPAADPVAPATSAQADARMHRFSFEPRGKTPGPSDVRIIGTEPTPCGEVLVARVASIPLDDARLKPDWVVEFDAAGKALRRWGVPHEAMLVALDGQRVQFRTATGTYWSDAGGAVEAIDANGIDAGQARPASLVDGGRTVECPDGLDGGPSGWQCATVSDAAGASRRVAVETVCS